MRRSFEAKELNLSYVSEMGSSWIPSGSPKRLGFGVRGYPSVSRIAVDPWIRGLANTPELKPEFDGILKACKELYNRDALPQA